MTLSFKALGALGACLGLAMFVALQFAIIRYTCVYPDGVEQAFFGWVLPYRTEFDATNAEVPVLWVFSYIVNVVAVALLAWILFGRSLGRTTGHGMGLKSGLSSLAFGALMVWMASYALAGYTLEDQEFGPDRGLATCETEFWFFPGAAASYGGT